MIFFVDHQAVLFQRIDADGKAGPRTIEELNVPVETRVNQLRASLERMRWVFRDLPDEYLVVDIAGFNAYLFEGGEEIWETRVQVGTHYHQTPVFSDSMSYVVMNPTWTVPYSIATKEMLPRVKQDPDGSGPAAGDLDLAGLGDTL